MSQSMSVLPQADDFSYPSLLTRRRCWGGAAEPNEELFEDSETLYPSASLASLKSDAPIRKPTPDETFSAFRMSYSQLFTDNNKTRIEHKVKSMIQLFIFSQKMQVFILLAIVFNTVMICIETDANIKAQQTLMFQIAENICLAIFVVEIILKMVYNFVEFWQSGWNWFDLIVVGASLLGSTLPFLSSVRIIRVLRVFRSIRIFRAVSMVPQLQRIFSAFMKSLPQVINVMILVLIFVIVCAFVGVSMFRYSSPTWFGDIWRSMYSLVILLTMDGWLDMYYELRDKGDTIWAMIYIYVVILVGANIFVNILVGVSVNGLNVMEAEYAQAERSEKFLDDMPAATIFDANADMRVPPLPTDAVWTSQRPAEKPRFKGIDQTTLAKMYILRRAMEENQQKMQEHVQKIATIRDTVAQLNKKAANVPNARH